MEPQSNRSLTFSHISNASSTIIQYMKDRKEGNMKSLRTRWSKFNNSLCGGLEPNVVWTIGGISGSGKSSFINTLETDLVDLNPKEDIIILNFSLEMVSSKQIGRKLSYKLKKTTSELYSGVSPLEDVDFQRAIEESKKISQYPIYYVDTPGTVEEVENTIRTFLELYAKGKWLIILYDHTLLTKTKSGEGERETLSNLQRLFIDLKKINKTSIIQLTQLNREIESSERINNPALHFPQRRDISSSDSIYHASDLVMIIHRPEVLGLKSYSLRNLPVENIIYLHLLKVREGEPKVLSFSNNLKYNSIEEVSL